MVSKEKIKSIQSKKSEKKPEGVGEGLFFDKKSNTWGFRAVRGGKDTRKKGFATKKEARDARVRFLAEHNEVKNVKKPDKDTDVTLREVYDHYMEFGSAEKRDGTLRKQKSLWKNHIEPVFGDRTLVSIGVGELKNYLTRLYYEGSVYNNFSGGYEYSYVEGFLKMFYLLWGYARRMFWISRDTYSIMCEDKKIRLEMPKKDQEDEDEENIETYTREEIDRMAKRLESTNLYTAFLCGYYLGVRISECFGMRWSDINWTNHTITIQRQLLMQSPHRVIAPCKTTAAKRTIEIPDKLYEHLKNLKKEQEENQKYYGTSYRNSEVVKVRMKKNQDDDLLGGNFINRQRNGQLLTTDSMKSWAVKIEAELGIHFKFHNLRHTHASFLAACNTPIPKLQHRMGHKKISTTSKYYFGKNEIADEKLKEALKLL